MINILFSGDFAPLISLCEIDQNPFNEINDLLLNTDLHITNLESPLTSSRILNPKSGPSIRAYMDSVALLRQANVGIACLANNHIFDFGEQGITDTLDVLSRNKIDTIGIVNRKDTMDHFIIRSIKDRKFGFLNYCEHESSVRANGLLGASGFTYLKAYYDISTLRSQVDFIIVIYHGGNEYYPLPSPYLKSTFHYLADIGADAVIGHHTHVFSGLEIRNGKPLVYGLGNFFFPYPDEPESWHQGLLFILEIDEKINFKLKHFIQCKNGVRLHYPLDKEELLLSNRFNELSSIIANDEELQKHWEDFVYKNGSGLRSKLLFSNKAHKLLAKSGIINPNLNRARSIENIIKCSSLRSLLLDSFKYYR